MSPTLTIICGPNGSGKSTLTDALMREFEFGRYINADEIASRLTGSPDEASREAQRLAEAAREECLAERIDFSFETVFSHPSKLEFMERAAALGYFVFVIFVTIENPAINVDRVRLRVEAGGHDVPEDRIVARWHRTMKLLPEIVRRCHRAMIFDNSNRASHAAVRRVAWASAEGNTVTVHRLDDAPEWLSEYLPEPSLLRPARH